MFLKVGKYVSTKGVILPLDWFAEKVPNKRFCTIYRHHFEKVTAAIQRTKRGGK